MASFDEALRHFWLRDIQRIGSVRNEELRQWFGRRMFVFSQVNGTTDFVIRVIDPNGAKQAIAHDSTKMASAAFETMIGITVVAGLPKSAAWILIKAYYAGFFAAHSLLRMFGTNCIQLDGEAISAFDRVAQSFGQLPGTGFESGYYVASYDTTSNEIHFRKSAAARRGSHEVLWETFSDKLRQASNHLLTVSAAFNLVSSQLSDVESYLRQDGHNGGSWLSHLRNRTNYRQEFGLWFPYASSTVDGQALVNIVRKVWDEPSTLFPVDQSNSIVTHICVCTIIVSLCYGVALDMEANGVRRRCFHSYGALALKRLAKA